MPTSNSGRESRRNSKTAPSINGSLKSSSDRRQKAQSTQVYDSRRRPSQQSDNGLRISSSRPDPKGRTNSAPLVQTINEPGPRKGLENGEKTANSDLNLHSRAAAAAVNEHGQDEDEVAGVVGAIKHFEPFRSPQSSEPLPDINIAVIGAERVGKSTFTQNALDLPFRSDSRAIERKIEIGSNDYLLRMLEIPIDDVDIDDDDTVSWPDTIEDKLMPRIDGVLTLYDVKDQSSLENVPEMLTAIGKAEIPSLLVACKCDARPEDRDINPRVVEQSAKRQIEGLDTLRVSANAPQTHKQGVSMILQAIVSGGPDQYFNQHDGGRTSSPSRPRAQSNTVTSQSANTQNERGHLRAASEYSGSLYKDKLHAKHDSKLAGFNSSDRLHVHDETPEDEMRGSFLIEESSSDTSDGASQSSQDVELRSGIGSRLDLSDNEEGSTFEELVERLLKQPTSKADNKFVAVFLALYRKFAAPSQLLEILVQRFDDLDSQRDASIIKTISQLRYLSVLDQWLGTYPGDFAFPKTYRRMRTFIGKLSQTRIFAVAAKEMSSHLDSIREDDDTNWAYCDRDRTIDVDHLGMSLSNTASVLIDDPTFLDGFLLAPTPMEDDEKTLVGTESEPYRSTTSSLHPSQHTTSIEMAQQQANLLQPIPRQPMSKVQWRALMDHPDDIIARELTRIDWIMFSAIRPRDLVRQVSLTKAEKKECKNLVYVDRMVEYFNQLAFWVENFILLRDKPKHRALMLEKFMRVARKLREVNNYNSLGAIIAGVKSSAVHRLAMTRELLPPTVGKDWMRLEMLMAPSRSYSAYRLAWDNSSAERIPYIPLHRRDLVSAESGNKTFIGDERDGKINWRKFEIMGEVIVSMQKAQGMPYKGLNDTRGKEQLKELILDVKLVKDEDELHARSKQLEPSGTPAMGTTAKFKELFKR